MIIVQKYGGSSVATIKQIQQIARHIKKDLKKLKNIVVVVSAMGKTTNNLISQASELSKSPNTRELDMLLHIGEIQSISLLAMALQQIGISAISLTGKQAKIKTNSFYGKAFIQNIDIRKIRKELHNYKVVIIAGFQGYDKYDNVTTLGRGGSDTTAVAIASQLHCPCEIYTDVKSVYTIDPRLYSKAKTIHKLNYIQMLEMAISGSKILEPRCVELAQKYNVPIYVGKTLVSDKSKGSYIMNDNIENMKINNLSLKENIIFITIPTKNNNTKQVLNNINNAHINLEMFSVDNRHITFCCNINDYQKIKKDIKNIKTIKDIDHFSLIGLGLITHPEFVEKLIITFNHNNIEIIKLNVTENNISFLTKAKDRKQIILLTAKLFNL